MAGSVLVLWEVPDSVRCVPDPDPLCAGMASRLCRFRLRTRAVGSLSHLPRGCLDIVSYRRLMKIFSERIGIRMRECNVSHGMWIFGVCSCCSMERVRSYTLHLLGGPGGCEIHVLSLGIERFYSTAKRRFLLVQHYVRTLDELRYDVRLRSGRKRFEASLK